jgi:hypothetical protein
VCFIVRRTTLELECTILTTLVLPVQKTLIVGALEKGICRVLFHLDVLMVVSEKLSFIANGSNPTHVSLTPGETICFGS